MKIEHIDSTLFDWLIWRSGHPLDLGILCCREKYIVERKVAIQKYAIGYCNGESLACRPKIDHKAIMFFKDGVTFWFHLTNKEFNDIFK